jgi:hypothetical protein
MRLGGSGGSDGTPAAAEVAQCGQEVFCLLSEVIRELSPTVQYEVARALTAGTAFDALSLEARSAFEELEREIWEAEEITKNDLPPAPVGLLGGGR